MSSIAGSSKDVLDNFQSLTLNEYPLHKAIKEFDHIALTQILKKSEDLRTFKCELDRRDQDGSSPLHVAAAVGNMEVISGLAQFAKYLSVNCKDNYGRTPLHKAVCGGGKAEVVRELLGFEGIHVNPRDQYGVTPFYYAVETCDEKTVEVLLETEGIDVNWTGFPPWTFLHSAAGYKKGAKLVKALLGHEFFRTNVHTRSGEGYTPLHWAVMSGSIDTVKMLLEVKDIEVNSLSKYGRTPLHNAALRGGAEKVKALLRHEDTQVNLKDENGRTALYLAVRYGKHDSVKALLEAENILVNIRDSEKKTPLHLAAECTWGAEIVKTLLRHEDTKVNLRDEDGFTPLGRAKIDCKDTVQALLKAGGRN